MASTTTRGRPGARPRQPRAPDAPPRLVPELKAKCWARDSTANSRERILRALRLGAPADGADPSVYDKLDPAAQLLDPFRS